jgi:hypothetical protein
MRWSKILIMLSSAWMMATGLRFVLMTEEAYFINLFDKIFDWGVLLLLGILLLTWNAHSYYKERRK